MRPGVKGCPGGAFLQPGSCVTRGACSGWTCQGQRLSGEKIGERSTKGHGFENWVKMGDGWKPYGTKK